MTWRTVRIAATGVGLLLGTVVVVVVVGPAAPFVALADDGLRCGSRLVGVGDHMRDVQKRCGEPESISQRTERRKVQYKTRRWADGVFQEVSEEREVDVVVDEWVYDFGPQRFVRYVSFENNRVVHVRSGERGGRKD